MITIEKLLPTLKARMQHRITEQYDDSFLLTELSSAFQKVAKKRWVNPKDLEDIYANDIVNIALYNIALIGGDFQTHHSENGISRTFVTEEEILRTIPTRARGLWYGNKDNAKN